MSDIVKQCFEIQTINDHFRVTHIATDSRVATCYQLENAKMVCGALNDTESLRQQLAELEDDEQKAVERCVIAEQRLAECQAREKVLQEMVGRWLGDEGWGAADMDAYDDCLAGDSTALDTLKKQWQREALAWASEELRSRYDIDASREIAILAKELE